MFYTQEYMKKSERPKILLMLSGGLDALGALWLLLTEEKYADYDILVQHIRLKTVQRRDEAEYRAFRQQLEFFAKVDSVTKEGTGEVISVAPFFVMPVLEVDETRKIGATPDYELILFYAGRLCQSRYEGYEFLARIKKVALGIQPTDEGWRKGFGSRAWNVFEAMQEDVEAAPFHKDFAANKIELELPVATYSKFEILKLLPTDLRTNFWSCREPLSSVDRFFECGVCKTCQEIRPLRERLLQETTDSQRKAEALSATTPDVTDKIHWRYLSS